MKIDKKDGIKMSIAISIVFIIILVVLFIVIQYQVEGEKNMPYELSKITIISTAEGQSNINEKEKKEKWNFSINQNNDIYFFIDKKTDKKDELIEKVRIENIKLIKEPLKGNIKTFMPNSLDGRKFSNKDEYIVNEKLEYNSGVKSDSKILEIGNQGGNVLIRFANVGVADLISDKENEIKHDGTLLNKVGITEEELKFKVNFDFIIEVKSVKYKANITLDLPNNNLLKEGTTIKEIIPNKDNNNNIIFKRIR